MSEIITTLKDSDILTNLIGSENISFLIISIGLAYLTGLFLLTVYYNLHPKYIKNLEWKDLGSLEKSVFGIIVGGLSLFVSILMVGILELLTFVVWGKNTISSVSPYLLMFFPLAYFFLCAHLKEENKLNFIKEFIWLSVIIIAILFIIFLLSFFLIL